MSQELTKQNNELAVALNQSVLSVVGEEKLMGFEKAFQMANAIAFLQEQLTPEVMNPIMALQGSKLGFKTDKDKDGGYPMQVVKNCLIDAVLTGLQPYGNMFNVIGGNMYPTKEGMGELLKKAVAKGLRYSIKHSVPKIDPSKTFATVQSTIKWTFNGEDREEMIEHAIKGNAYATSDAYVGKAERKARYFLVSQLYDIEITDGDVEDVEHVVVETKQPVDKQSHEEVRQRIFLSTIMDKEKVKNIPAEELQDTINLHESLKEVTTVEAFKELAASREFTDTQKEMMKQKQSEFKKPK